MKNSAREKASSTEGVDYNEQSFMTVLQSLGEKLPGAIIGPAIASKLGVQEAQIDSYNNSEIKLKELGAGNDITGKITKEEGGKWKIELKKGEEGETTNSVADSEIKGKIDELVSQLENNDATEAAAQASEAIDTSTPFGELLTPGEGQQDKAKAQIRRRLRIERNNNISINNGEVVVSGFSYSGSGAITPNVDYSIHIKQEDGVIKFWVKLDNGTEKDKISVNSNSINDFKTAFNQAKESVT
jgi:hypothetical protein